MRGRWLVKEIFCLTNAGIVAPALCGRSPRCAERPDAELRASARLTLSRNNHREMKPMDTKSQPAERSQRASREGVAQLPSQAWEEPNLHDCMA